MKKLIMLVVLGLMFSSVVLAEDCRNCNQVTDEYGNVQVEVSTDAEQMVEEIPNVDPEPIITPEVVKKHRKTGSYMPITKPVYVWDVVRFGDRGENVKTLQMYLNNKGASLKVDGVYGKLTLQAFELHILK